MTIFPADQIIAAAIHEAEERGTLALIVELRRRLKNDSCITSNCVDDVYGGIETLKPDQLDREEREEMKK